MPTPPALRQRSPVYGRPWLRKAMAAGVVFWAAVSGQGPAWAAPDDKPDAVTRMLIERGLLPPDATHVMSGVTSAAPTLAQKVRDSASDMVLTAMNFLGVPYRRGGTNENTGFDCSGFTRHIFEMSLGLVLPHRAAEQANAAGLTQVGRDDLRPGDLVFFNTMRRTFSHVGIYIGDGKFIHSPSVGGAVRVDDMRFSYWNQRYNGARRVGPLLDQDNTPKADAPLGPGAR